MEPVITLSAGGSKWDIRHKVWDYIEDNNLADFPRPVHHRIPNFKGAARACERLTTLQDFQSAKTVKINPDTPQKNARFLTLQTSRQAGHQVTTLEVFGQTREIKVDPDKPLEGVRLAALQANKTLLVPTPRLRTGLFNRITPPPGASKEVLRVCSTSQGVKDFSVPLGLDSVVRVDLVVVGSVAVSEKGWRIGKGEGFADMEYAMMVAMGAVTEQTVVVTVVHDCQVLDIPEELLDDHDLTVDYILTPTRVIRTNCTRPKPRGIIWSKISREMMSKIPVLRRLHEIERSAGKDVTLRSEDSTLRSPTNGGTRHAHTSQTPPIMDNPGAAEQKEVTTVYIGNIPPATRVSELKSILRGRGASPVHLTWQGPQHRAFLDYSDPLQARKVVSSLEGLSIAGQVIQVELARTQRNKVNGHGGQKKRNGYPKHASDTAGKSPAEDSPNMEF